MSIRIEDVTITYSARRDPVVAVRNVSLDVAAGHTLGVVGESGSGKSTLGLGTLMLLPPGCSISGRILFHDVDLLGLTEAEMAKRRGRGIGMVFQDSLASLNPVFSVGSQLSDTLKRHHPGLTRRQALKRAAEMLEEVGLQPRLLKRFPHQLSGGMRQRVMIAAALAPEPEFLVADESTSDLDTVTERQILDLLHRIQADRGIGLIVISHDLGVIYHTCEKVAVMYRGELVEHGAVEQVLARPKHWYTQGLVAVSRKDVGPDGYLETLPSRVDQGPDGVGVLAQSCADHRVDGESLV